MFRRRVFVDASRRSREKYEKSRYRRARTRENGGKKEKRENRWKRGNDESIAPVDVSQLKIVELSGAAYPRSFRVAFSILSFFFFPLLFLLSPFLLLHRVARRELSITLKRTRISRGPIVSKLAKSRWKNRALSSQFIVARLPWIVFEPTKLVDQAFVPWISCFRRMLAKIDASDYKGWIRVI